MFLAKLFNRVTNYHFLILLFSFLLFCTPFFWFSNDSIIVGGETFTIVQPNIWRDQVFSLWDSFFGFGAPSTNFISAFYYYLVIFLSGIFGVSIGQKIVFGLSLLATFLSAIYFFETFSSKKSVMVILLALFSVFNPFYIMMFPWFPTYPMLFIVTFVFLAQYISMIKRKISLHSFMRFTLISFFAISLAVNISMFTLFLLLVLVFSIWLLLISQDRKMLMLRMVVAGAYFSIIQSFWVIPIISMAKSLFSGAELYRDSVSDISLYIFGIVKGITLNQFYFFDKYDTNSILFFTYSRWYQNISILLLLTLILLAIGAIANKWSSIQKSQKSFLLFASIIFASGVFLSKGNAHPFGEMYVWMLLNVPLFSMFRSPDIKFPFFSFIGISLLILRTHALFISECGNRLRTFFTFSFFSIICILGLPMLTGEVFHEKFVVSIPEYWSSVSGVTKDGSRALLLPKSSSVLDNFSWGYEGRWLAFQFSQTPVINYSPSYGTLLAEKRFTIIDQIYLALENNNKELFQELLDVFGIDTIIVQNDFDMRKNSHNYLSFSTDFDKNRNSYSQMLVSLERFAENSFKPIKVGQIDIYKSQKQEIITSNAAVSAFKIFDSLYLINGDVCSISNVTFKMSFDEGWQLRRLQNMEERNIFVTLLLLPFTSKKVNAEHSLFYGYGNYWRVTPDNDCERSQQLIIIYWPQVIFAYAFLISLLSVPVFYSIYKKVFSYDLIN